MTPWVPIAALYLCVLVRALVPAEHPAHTRRPLGCSICMSGWACLVLVLLAYPPSSVDALRLLPLRWFSAACCTWLGLEAWERVPPSSGPPSGMLPPE